MYIVCGAICCGFGGGKFLLCVGEFVVGLGE